MQLNLEQKKIVQSKPAGHALIRGVAGSGKTTVAVNRIPFLLENYCIEKDDRVLMVTYNKSLISYIKYIYEKVKKENENGQLSLFQVDDSRLNIKNIDSLMYSYYLDYCKAKNLKLNVESKKAVLNNIILNAMAEMRKSFDDVKILDQRNQSFIMEEIAWIKACRYMDIEEYQNADRLGRMTSQTGDGPQKLQKNSKTRSAIFKVMEVYNRNMKAENKIDFQDMSLMALEQAKRKSLKKYTHIISDESQDLTIVQLEFVAALVNNKTYSSVLFVADIAQSIYPQSWLVKGRSFSSVGFDVKGRSNILAKNYRTTTQIAEAAYSLLENDTVITEDENFVKPSLLDKQGVYPVFRAFENKHKEALYVINLLFELSRDYKYGDIAVIGRTNEQINEFAGFIATAAIPYKLMTTKDGYEFGDEKVKLLTMHGIKGLEFKVVIIIGLNSKSMPLKSIATDDRELFETRERKLLYVGMTRATEKLYMTADGFPSKFIRDINPKFLKYDEEIKMSNFYSIKIEKYAFKDNVKDVYSQEEKVRQWIINELKESYKYPERLIDIEYKVNSFSRIGYVDVVVSIYKNNNKVPYIFVEVKRPGAGIVSCLEQLKSYMAASPVCQYGIATDGVDVVIINRDLEAVKDIPDFMPSMLPSSLENYCYVDIRNNRQYKFMRDCGNATELIFDNDEVADSKDLRRLPVFNGIAAGKPIMLDSNVEEEFFLPDNWFAGHSDCYMVKVKGDSMINAGINHGDLVVIKRQDTANNYEIAAVDLDGTTTLKRFVRMGSSILLMPDNANYEPISVMDEDVRILGVVVGVVKRF